MKIILERNDLLPAEYSTTTEDNMNYVLFKISHFNTAIGFSFIYKLQNIQTIIGEPIQIDWVLEVIEGDQNWFGYETIIAAPFADPIFGGGQFSINNNTPYPIMYHSPHSMFDYVFTDPDEVGGQNEQQLLGDINNDGIIDITDLVTLINNVLAEEYLETADINQDGIIDILDIVLLMNTILGNE